MLYDCTCSSFLNASADPEGGQGVRTPPPLENHKLNGFLKGISNLDPPPGKS